MKKTVAITALILVCACCAVVGFYAFAHAITAQKMESMAEELAPALQGLTVQLESCVESIKDVNDGLDRIEVLLEKIEESR